MEDDISLSTNTRQNAPIETELALPQSQEQPHYQPSKKKSSSTTLVGISESGNLYDSKAPIPHELPGEEIEYIYLTFDTILPSPSTPTTSSTDNYYPNLPPPPDLKPYTSPFEWPRTRKTVITCIACTVTVLSAASAGCNNPAEAELTRAWGISSVLFNLGITVYTTGFAIAPMLLAPFSEINGRRPMFLASGLLFLSQSQQFKFS